MAGGTTGRRPVLCALTVLLAVSGCAGRIDLPPRTTAPDPAIPPCDGITVVVDGRALAGTGNGGFAEPTAQCLETDQTMTAQAALTTASITATRTSQDLPAAVCRVDGDPFDRLAIAKPRGGIYFETCTSTPPDYARWVVWNRSSGADWTSEDQDVTTLELSPGESLALVYAYRGEPSAPSF